MFAFSRATNLRNIGINGGCARERLMEEISNKPYLKLRKKADEALTQLTEKTKRKLLEEQRLLEERRLLEDQLIDSLRDLI